MASKSDIKAGSAFIELALKGRAQVEKALASIAGKFKAMGAAMQGIGLRMGAVGAALGMALAPTIGAASDLSESLSKSGVVFGDLSKEVEAFGDTAATSVGMSKQAAVEAAATFGNFLQAMGAGQGEAKDMSLAMVKLAADLASFNNANPEDVLLALRSGLSGEAEPMRRFGVALSETAVKAKAAEMGIAPLGAELTEQQKIMARYAIIMEQTQMAQGDFERTSGGLANQQRIAAAQFEDAKAALGQALLPAYTAALKAINAVIKPTVAWMQANQGLVKIIAAVAAVLVVGGGLLVAIGTAFMVASAAVSGLVAAVGFLLSPLGLVIAGVAAAAVALGLLAKWAIQSTGIFGGLSEQFGETWKAIKTAMGSGDLKLAFQIALAQLKLSLAQFIAPFLQKWREIADAVRSLWDSLMSGLRGEWEAFKAWVTGGDVAAARAKVANDAIGQTNQRDAAREKAMQKEAENIKRLKDELDALRKKAADTAPVELPKGSKIQFKEVAAAATQAVTGKISDLQRGTFSAEFASRRLGLGAIGPQERTAKATEKAAKTLDKIEKEVKGMAIEFA